MTNIFEAGFGSVNGRRARLFTIENESLKAQVTDLGASLAGLFVRRADGSEVNAVLGYASAEGYAEGSSFVGATVGRYAGRIANARFTLEGREYRLIENDGPNHLHGGFNKRFWDAEKLQNGIGFTLCSPDMDEGFPGRLFVGVRYELSGRTLCISYEAFSDRCTVLNLTNHSYFNLEGGGDVSGHELTLRSNRSAELGPGMIPTGRLPETGGSPLDFTVSRALGGIELDNSFIIEGAGMREAARLYSPKAGIMLICRTTEPSVHVYTADQMHRDAAFPFAKRGGVCLETQHLPDSPNKPCFPSTILKAGERFGSRTEYELITDP